MAGPKSAPLEPKIIERLLDLLSDSDKFRELFQQDPAAALEMIGHDVGDQAARTALASQPAIAGCMQVGRLASKSAIRAAHAEIKKMLLAGLAQTTPNLDATLDSSD
ncbi:NHLP-related RiPP peptide [Lysobacter terrae]